MRFFHIKSLKSNIMIYFSVIFIIVLCIIGLVGYRFFSQVLTNEILSYTEKIIAQTSSSIDLYFGQIKNLTQITAGNEEIINAIKEDELSIGSSFLYNNRKISDVLQETKKFNRKIKDLIIIKKDGTCYNYSNSCVRKDYNFYEQDWFPKYEEKYAKVCFTGIHSQDYYVLDNNLGNVVSTVIPIMDYTDPNREFYAMLLCNLNISDIADITQDAQLGKTGFFLILDNNNELVYNPTSYQFDNDFKKNIITNLSQQSGQFVSKHDKENVLVVYKTSTITGWKIISIIPMKEILSHLDNIKIFTFFLIIICVFIVIIVSIFISRSITKPISGLMKKMENIGQGNFDIKLYDNSTIEMEMLSSNIDVMIESINKLNEDIYSYKMKSKEAEVKMLQSQINPHFLYNTLQSVKALALLNKTKDISKMVTLIGNMLRYSIYDLDKLVPINSEIKHVSDYIRIQNYRYSDKFDYRIDSEIELSNLQTLKLILQPIVENSIIHGLQENIKGIIAINVFAKDNDIYFEINDNGKGMTLEELEKIKMHINDKNQKDQSKSIGLKNVNERIKLKYGDRYGLSIASKSDIGTSVTIIIPKINS
ncbi:cache domain-containing sensor histidine kinase [Vallitalea longa]|uniref:cache domain-containing sensor histidine kinase n=1 Tax=Vallitalea longa TaxID=2936439 RepID=UPI0024912BB4|nr:sensor histidine kinase [Vallitalea longa]